MLIKTDRHTKSDLELWDEYVKMDLVYYEINKEKFDNKINKAINEIKDWYTDGYSGTSWGKDSVTVCHLIYLSGLKIPIINLKIIPSQNPYCTYVRDEFLKKYNIQYEEIKVDYTDILKRNLPDNLQDIETDKKFYKGFFEAGEKYGHKHISGVRASESSIRTLSRKKHGISTIKTCRPIIDWKEQDVFTYLAINDLPTHPNYAMLGGGRYERNRLRVAEVGDITGNNFGRKEWEQEYYPDILRRIHK
jgi:phosphoadenosine phosphosulfate reductase